MAGFGELGGGRPEFGPNDDAVPGWVRPYPGFRQAPIDDRRGEGWVGQIGSIAAGLKRELTPQRSWDEIKLMLQHPLTPFAETMAKQPSAMSLTPLGIQAGMLDIDPVHQAWVAQRRAAEQAAVQADPNVHSFDEPVDPNGPPITLDRRKRY